MATDATGTPTSPDGIPTYNTAVDAPSGKGFNAAMAVLQTALSGRVTSPVGIVTGETPVYNGTSYVRSSVTPVSISGLDTRVADKGTATQQTFTANILSPTLLVGNVDTQISRAILNAQNVVQIGGSANPGISTGGVPNALTTAGWTQWSAVQSTIGTVAGNNIFAGGVLNDSTYRYTVKADGTTSWGPGTGATDTILQRSATLPPSGNKIGLTINNPFNVSDPAGLTVTQITNSAALSTYLLSTDANPAFKLFAQGAMLWGAGGASVGDLELARVVNSPSGTGSFLELVVGQGVGYGTGTGGAVTQLTSRTTGVTINKPSGQITMSTTPTTVGNYSFVVTNSCVGVDDTIVLSWKNAGTNQGFLITTAVAAGSFTICVQENTVDATAWVINFAVIKGAVA